MRAQRNAPWISSSSSVRFRCVIVMPVALHAQLSQILSTVVLDVERLTGGSSPPLCSHVISSVLSGLLSLLPGFARLHAKYAPRMSFAFPGALGRTPSLFDTDAPFPRTTTMTNRYCNGRRRAQKTWVLNVSVGRKGASDACASSRKVVVVVWDMVGGRWSPSTLVLCATLQSQVCLIQGVACRPFSGSRSTRVVIISHAHVCTLPAMSLHWSRGASRARSETRLSALHQLILPPASKCLFAASSASLGCTHWRQIL